MIQAKDIAAAAERSISGQTELLTTLALAVIGGLLALLVKIKAHNAVPANTPIIVQQKWMMWMSLGFAALTVGMTLFIQGTLVEISPQMFTLSVDVSKSFSDQDFGVAPYGQLKSLALLQFLSFALSVVFGVLFVTANGP